MKSFVPSRRDFLLMSTAIAASGCFGKFGATTALYDWNKGVSDNKWLRWLVFLVLIIVPVYELFMFADAIVINTIEFWTGDNPVSGGHAKLKDGSELYSSRTQDPDVIRHEIRKDGKVTRVYHVKRVGDGEMLMLDEHMQLLGRARLREDGSVELLDADGKELSALSVGAMDRVAMAVDAGAAPTQAVFDAVDHAQRDQLMALSQPALDHAG